MLESSRSQTDKTFSFPDAASGLLAWVRREPVTALLLAASVAVIVYFFGWYEAFIGGTQSTVQWAWAAWNPENNQEHSKIVLPIALGLVWFHRDLIADARKTPWNPGLLIVAFGVCCYVLAARSLQPRIAIFSFPVIILGAVAFLWGRQVARVVLFPCAFLLFLIPLGNLVQGTVSLQILVSTVCNALASFIGMKIEASGTTIHSLDGSFNFEIAEGCSGIRSLMAMMTLTALYVHFTQREWWKKGVIFAGSLVFAVVGNIGRIFTVILVAKFINPTLAGGIYHDYSGFIFFPIAVMAMVGFGHLVNHDWAARNAPRKAAPVPLETAAEHGESKPPSPVSYDY